MAKAIVFVGDGGAEAETHDGAPPCSGGDIECPLAYVELLGRSVLHRTVDALVRGRCGAGRGVRRVPAGHAGQLSQHSFHP